jgi:hypothetical protein
MNRNIPNKESLWGAVQKIERIIAPFYAYLHLSSEGQGKTNSSGGPLINKQLIIQINNKGWSLNWEILGENTFLVDKLNKQSSYKRLAILLCLKALQSVDIRTLTLRANQLIQNGFKIKSPIAKARGSLANKSRQKDLLHKQIPDLNDLFTKVKLPEPIIKNSMGIKWNNGVDNLIIFTDSNKTILDSEGLQKILSKYHCLWERNQTSTTKKGRPRKPEPRDPAQLPFIKEKPIVGVNEQLEGKKEHSDQS